MTDNNDMVTVSLMRAHSQTKKAILLSDPELMRCNEQAVTDSRAAWFPLEEITMRRRPGSGSLFSVDIPRWLWMKKDLDGSTIGQYVE